VLQQTKIASKSFSFHTLLLSEAQVVASQAKKNIEPEKSHRGLQGS
jgi:hypothetical protein